MAVSVADLWGCIAEPEQAVNALMADASVSMTQFVPRAVVNAVFEAYSPGWGEERRIAWQRLYAVLTGTVIIGETEVPVFLATSAWMIEVGVCRFGGGCEVDGPYCPERIGFGLPT